MKNPDEVFVPGRFFRHYKGEPYMLLEIGEMESGTTQGMQFAVYRNLNNGPVWIRPMHEFMASVPAINGDGEATSVLRFAPIEFDAVSGVVTSDENNPDAEVNNQ